MSNPGPAITISAHPSNVSTNQSKRLLAVIKGVSVNATGAFSIPVTNSTQYLVTDLYATNLNNAGASVTPTGLALTVSAGGTSLFAAITPANLATPAGISVSAASASTTTYSNQQLIGNITTALATPLGATIDLYAYGLDFS
jgi:hypothetical protein